MSQIIAGTGYGPSGQSGNTDACCQPGPTLSHVLRGKAVIEGFM